MSGLWTMQLMGSTRAVRLLSKRAAGSITALTSPLPPPPLRHFHGSLSTIVTWSIHYPQYSQHQRRSFSSRQRRRSFKLDAIAFSIAPEDAIAKFQTWATEDQGLRYLLSRSSVKIAAAYVPLWSFDVNLRFKVKDGQSSSSSWRPSMFQQAYPENQSTIYLSGLGVYAGHSYRRTLLNPIHNTTLVFMGDQLQPFGTWMLRDMEMSNGERLEVFPDPWNASKAQAQTVLRQDLSNLTTGENPNAQLQMQVVAAKRVYMPTYVIEYSILGMEYQAFLSGCDDGADVSGVNHQLWGNNTAAEGLPSSQSVLEGLSSATQFGLRTVGSRGIGTLLIVILQFLGSIAARVLMRLPVVALFGGIFVGFRKIIYPWMDHRYASAEWERQREREQAEEQRAQPVMDDFDDIRGTAKRYFETNRERILKTLGGEQEHHRGDYDWYKEWEEWARRQYEQQQQQQGSYGQQQQSRQRQQQQTYGRQQQTQRAKPKPNYKWDFDPNDPYSVLGIRRGASKSEVSAAFRREMLKYHPDVNVNASDAERERSQERSKYITEAYRKIKAEMK